MKEVTLHIAAVGGNPEKAAELTVWLKDQIKQLPVESIEIPKTGALPEGARVGDPFSWGTLVVVVAPVVVEQLFNLLRDRLKRQKAPVKIEVECDGKHFTIDANPEND